MREIAFDTVLLPVLDFGFIGNLYLSTLLLENICDRMGGKKIAKAKTITVPDSVSKRGVGQYIAYAAEEFEREVKLGYSEDRYVYFSNEMASLLREYQTQCREHLAFYEQRELMADGYLFQKAGEQPTNDTLNFYRKV